MSRTTMGRLAPLALAAALALAGALPAAAAPAWNALDPGLSLWLGRLLDRAGIWSAPGCPGACLAGQEGSDLDPFGRHGSSSPSQGTAAPAPTLGAKEGSQLDPNGGHGSGSAPQGAAAPANPPPGG
jgi:hypothetical protein